MVNPDLLWYHSSLLSILHPCCLCTLRWFFWGFFYIVLSCFMILVMDFSFCLLSFSICFFFVVVVVLVFVDFPPSSISVQAAKLQWSLDEKVGSSRGTRVSRPFVHLCVCVCWCWCVALLSGLTSCGIKLPRITTLVYFTKCQIFHFYGKPLCSLNCAAC